MSCRPGRQPIRLSERSPLAWHTHKQANFTLRIRVRVILGCQDVDPESERLRLAAGHRLDPARRVSEINGERRCQCICSQLNPLQEHSRIIDVRSMPFEFQTCSSFTLFLLLHFSCHGQAFIVFTPKVHRFVRSRNFGAAWRCSHLSQSTMAHLKTSKSKSFGESKSCSRQAMKDNSPDHTAFGANMNGEHDDGPNREWRFVRKAVTRLGYMIDAVRKFVWTSFHRLLVVRFIWLMQCTAFLKSALLDSTRSFSSSRPQV
jgi:hypothetical protein